MIKRVGCFAFCHALNITYICLKCWWTVTVCCETLMFTLTDIFEGQSCLFGWTSSGVWLPGLTSPLYQIEEFVSKALSNILRASSCRSDRVKSCDLHPTEQWMLVSLYNGNVHIWNYESQQLVKSFEVGDHFRLELDWVPFSDLQVCDLHFLTCRFAIFQSERRFLYQGRTGSSLVLMICRLILFVLPYSD